MYDELYLLYFFFFFVLFQLYINRYTDSIDLPIRHYFPGDIKNTKYKWVQYRQRDVDEQWAMINTRHCEAHGHYKLIVGLVFLPRFLRCARAGEGHTTQGI